MTMQEQLRAALLAAQSTPVQPTDDSSPPAADDFPLVEALADVETDSALSVNVTPPEPVKPTFTIKNLDEKAVLVQVKRRMYSPYKHDAEASVSGSEF